MKNEDPMCVADKLMFPVCVGDLVAYSSRSGNKHNIILGKVKKIGILEKNGRTYVTIKDGPNKFVVWNPTTHMRLIHLP